eukprot:TRINITY_DN4316_c2_g1_i4.p1 TRINITY_DN4316_c2_g1~~TRINITY_DN4316_c2_g1_i4.p1  ORF type:complete len:200 (-),score=-9.14 TRINITY_DN4316_c2_g1_i4:572-1171(-)
MYGMYGVIITKETKQNNTQQDCQASRPYVKKSTSTSLTQIFKHCEYLSHCEVILNMYIVFDIEYYRSLPVFYDIRQDYQVLLKPQVWYGKGCFSKNPRMGYDYKVKSNFWHRVYNDLKDQYGHELIQIFVIRIFAKLLLPKRQAFDNLSWEHLAVQCFNEIFVFEFCVLKSCKEFLRFSQKYLFKFYKVLSVSMYCLFL